MTKFLVPLDGILQILTLLEEPNCLNGIRENYNKPYLIVTNPDVTK